MVYDLMRAACKYVKHFVLGWAHPIPDQVVVYLGDPDHIECSILREVLKYTDYLEGRVEVEAFPADEDDVRPFLRVGDDALNAHGCMAMARYLGKHWRIYPTDPDNALVVDSSLTNLQHLVDSLAFNDESLMMLCLARLEESMECHGGDHIDGFSGPTLSDVAWTGAIRYIVHHNIFELDIFPLVLAWWGRVE